MRCLIYATEQRLVRLFKAIEKTKAAPCLETVRVSRPGGTSYYKNFPLYQEAGFDKLYHELSPTGRSHRVVSISGYSKLDAEEIIFSAIRKEIQPDHYSLHPRDIDHQAFSQGLSDLELAYLRLEKSYKGLTAPFDVHVEYSDTSDADAPNQVLDSLDSVQDYGELSNILLSGSEGTYRIFELSFDGLPVSCSISRHPLSVSDLLNLAFR